MSFKPCGLSSRGDNPGGVEAADPGEPRSLGRAGHGQHHPDGADRKPPHPGESRATAPPLGRGDAGRGPAGGRALPAASASEDRCRRTDLSRWVPRANLCACCPPQGLALSDGTSGKEPACQCKRRKRHGFDLWVGKIPLEEEKAICSSILAWKIPWTEEPGGLQSMGSQRVRHTEVT